MEGWKCPVCGRGVAPSEKTCEHGAAHFGLSPQLIPGSWPKPPWRISDPGDAPYAYPTYTVGGIESSSTGILMNGNA